MNGKSEKSVSFTKKKPLAYTENETEKEAVMCQFTLRKLLGISAVCFGAGILLSFLLPGYFLAFLEAAVVIAAGLLLLGKRS